MSSATTAGNVQYGNIMDKMPTKPGFIKRILNSMALMKKPALGLAVKFYHDAIPYGSHGTVCASSNIHGIVRENIPFVFLGISTPPTLSLETMQYIISEAKHYGYNVHHIVSYGEANAIKVEPQIYRSKKSKEPEIAKAEIPNRRPYLKSNPHILRVK